MSSESFDPTQRQLCPDPSCIGVLAPDGRCPVCGRLGQPASQDAGAPATPTEQQDELPAAAPRDIPEELTGDDEGFASGRRLCPDGGCLGVLGPDGRCNVCGQSAS